MEKIDVLDNKGNKTGEVKLKSEAHRDGDWHKAVHVWIVNSKGEILLQLRSKDKDTHPDCWDISAAGHVSAGEDSITSAMRETEEELGVILEPRDFLFIGSVIQQVVLNNGAIINNEFNDIYIVRANFDLSSLKIQKEEIDDVRYISKEELKTWVEEERENLVPHKEEYELLFNFLEK